MGGQQFGAGRRARRHARCLESARSTPDRGSSRSRQGSNGPRSSRGWCVAGGPPRLGHRPEADGRRPAEPRRGARRRTSTAAGCVPPIVGDVESFDLVDADGALAGAAARENAELFPLAIGGYGLFGVITTSRCGSRRARKVERLVEVVRVDGLLAAFERRIAEGFIYGDFQYAIDADADDSCAAACSRATGRSTTETPIPDGQKELSDATGADCSSWRTPTRRRAFERVPPVLPAADGQVYWSDTHQLSEYLDGYHPALDRRRGEPGTEMITEVYVPRTALAASRARSPRTSASHGVPIIYGTGPADRAGRRELPAVGREPWACIIFNLHVEHTPAGIERAADFRRIIDSRSATAAATT